MFDFAWSEIALIGVVALVFIGPKDMPVAMRAVSDVVKKARKMAAEFRTHVDEMVKDTELSEVRKQISEIRNFDFKGAIATAVDDDGSLRRAFTEDPFKTTPSYTPAAAPTVEAAQTDGGVATLESEAPPLAEAVMEIETESAAEIRLHAVAASAEPEAELAPAFIPPSIASPPVPPAFIPPGIRSSAG
ncbi:MAG TPA: Sec-independent protein translocase protein TatB [Acetobacteraceae bacterium]|jgi:sec-independent protein translocase protein TatB|nr:Sec-independent protein translocase protein TatB [Acetobacteraceae bacterium]